MKDVEVGGEVSSQRPDRAGGHVDAVSSAQLHPDFFTLSAVKKPRDSYAGDDVVRMVGPRRDDPRKLSRSGRGKVDVAGTETLSLNGEKLAVCRRHDPTFSSKAKTKWLTASTAGILFPRECIGRDLENLLPAQPSAFLLLFVQEAADLYRALFLSSS